MLLNLKYSTKSKTKVISEISIKISLRNYPGPGKKGVEKVGEEIVKKCIGAGCPSTRPYMPPIETNNISSTFIKIKTDNKKEESQNTTEKTHTHKEIQRDRNITHDIVEQKDKKPFQENKTVEDFVKRLQENERELSRETHLREGLSYNYAKNTIFAGFHTGDVDSSLMMDNAIGIPALPLLNPSSNNIPIPPPLPEKNAVVPVSSPIEKTFKEELQKTCKDREIRALIVLEQLKLLEEQRLLKIQNDGKEMKLTKQFYDYLNEIKNKKILNYVEIPIHNLDFNSMRFDVGLLGITDIEKTLFFSGTQNHVIVWIHPNHQDLKIVFGYLTSYKTGSVKLSDQQPFNFDSKDFKEQYYVPLKNPLLVINDEHIKNLPIIEFDKDRNKLQVYIDQQQIGHNFVNSEVVKHILKEEIKKKLLDNKLVLEKYEGIGVTSEDIANVLQNKQQENLVKAQKHFQLYLNKLKQGKNIEIWLEGIQKTTPGVYEELQKLIEHHEKK